MQDYEHVYAFHQDDDYFTHDRWYAWKVVKRTPRYVFIQGGDGCPLAYRETPHRLDRHELETEGRTYHRQSRTFYYLRPEQRNADRVAEVHYGGDVDWHPSVAPPDLSSEVAVAKHTQRVRYLPLARRLPWRLRKAACIGGIYGGAIDLLRRTYSTGLIADEFKSLFLTAQDWDALQWWAVDRKEDYHQIWRNAQYPGLTKTIWGLWEDYHAQKKYLETVG
jgi:hypothetical protein